MPYYRTLRPREVSEIFTSPTCSIVVMRREFGEAHLLAFLTLVIIDLVEFFNVGSTMNQQQIAGTATLVMEEFYYLKPDDFKLCFDRAKKGRYGDLFGRLDGQVIFRWLNQYAEERTQAAADQSIKASEKFKKPRGMDIEPLYDLIQTHKNKHYGNNKIEIMANEQDVYR